MNIASEGLKPEENAEEEEVRVTDPDMPSKAGAKEFWKIMARAQLATFHHISIALAILLQNLVGLATTKITGGMIEETHDVVVEQML